MTYEGSFDEAEVCELVGLFMLRKLSNLLIDGSPGCYRDDGLVAMHKRSGPQLDKTRKDITKCYQEEGLQITIEIKLKIVDFLDVTFNLSTEKYYPFRKPNDTPLYIHKESNHPPNIITNPKNDIATFKSIFNTLGI